MIEINEYIQFGAFNSKTKGFFLIDRDAPTPNEKEILEEIPYMQGSLDFSNLLGERIYDNRDITYTFEMFNVKYDSRKDVENQVKRDLMTPFIEPLIDSHDVGYYWLGKCKSVKVDDLQESNKLRVVIVFDCYPLLIKQAQYYTDVMDDLSVDDIGQFTMYLVNGRKSFSYLHIGDASVTPIIHCTSKMTLYVNGTKFDLTQGENEILTMKFKIGSNNLEAVGNGTIRFRARTELMA